MDDDELRAMRTLSTAVQLLALAVQPHGGVTRPPLCPACHRPGLCDTDCDLAVLLLWPTVETERSRLALDSVIQNGPEPDSV